ncbi:MAG TPA: hypothetical protein VHW09_21645 [Bryobacteraceae bacterium]|nr:hypothetical protein [Bryobacteraceae bacterium]
MRAEIAARLAACDIETAAQANDYCMFVRGNCAALVRTAGPLASIGSSGILTEKGLAYLVWVDGKAMLSAHGSQVEAEPEQVEAIRKFSEDLKEILGPQIDADERQ